MTCLNCKNRTLGCHSKCLKYKEYKEQIEQQRERKKKLNICEYDYKYTYAKGRYHHG